MCKATIDLLSPNGAQVALGLSTDDDQQSIPGTLDRAEKIGVSFSNRGWTYAQGETLGPGAGEAALASELAQGPTLAGYPYSATVDERGLPTSIIVNGKQAQRREKQGDAWYSVRRCCGFRSGRGRRR